MSKKIVVERDDEQPYDSMSDPDIETDEKSTDIVSNKVLHAYDDQFNHVVFFLIMTWFSKQKKQTHTKKAVLTRNDVKEKIAKCKINRQRLDLRFVMIVYDDACKNDHHDWLWVRNAGNYRSILGR